MLCPYCEDEGGILIQTDDGTRCGDCGRLVEAPPAAEPEPVPEDVVTPTDEPAEISEDPVEEENFEDEELQAPSASVDEPLCDKSAESLPEDDMPNSLNELETALHTEDEGPGEDPLDAAFEEQLEEQPPQASPPAADPSPVPSPVVVAPSLAPSPVVNAPSPVPSPVVAPAPAPVASGASEADLEQAREDGLEAGRAEMQTMVEEMMMNLEEAMKAKADAESAKADVENLLQASMLACSKETMEKTKAQSEIQDLVSIIKNSESEHEGDSKALMHQLQKIEMENESMKGMVEADKVVLEDNKSEISDLRQNNERMQAELTQLQDEKEATRQALKQSDRKFELLKDQATAKLDEANSVCDGYESTIEDLRSQLQREQKNSQLTEESLEEARQQASDAEAAMSEMQREAATQQSSVRGLQDEIASLQQSVETLSREKDDALRASKVAKMDAESMSTDMKKARDELSNCKVDLQEAREQLGSSGSSGDTSAALRDSEARNADLLEQIAALKQGGGGGAGDPALLAQLAEKDEALAAKAKENDELQKVCDELFQLVEAGGGGK